MKRFYVLIAVLALVAFMPAGRAAADNENQLRAIPSVFVGTAPGCAPSPPGSRIVTAAWLNGMGLPDNAGANNNLTAAQRDDPRSGLLLSKNGLTTDCSAAGADITGVKGIVLTATSELGFDYRNGGHCGAGAGRFNVTVNNIVTGTQTFHFVGGCVNDTSPIAAPQDPAQWTRVRFGTSNAAESFPVIPPGSTVVSIELILDVGTDTASTQDPMGVGLAVIDNIYINGKVIASGDNSQKQNKDKKDKKDKGDHNGDNEGDDD